MVAPLALGAALARARALLPRPRRAPAEPGADMFGRIRRNLTWWYGVVLLGAFLLAGAVLYVAVDGILFNPIKDQLSGVANGDQIQRHCASPFDRGPGVSSNYFGGTFYVACFDGSGTFQQPPFGSTNTPPDFPSNFPSEQLAKRAIQADSNSALDVVDIPNLGPVERYALALSTGGGVVIAVVEVGTPIGREVQILHNFLLLLLGTGVMALLIATLGGLFLARRALQPARLAFARQQSFIADASHELRTPLTLLRADAEVLLRGVDRLPPDDRALLRDIVDETAHMARLAGTMLTLARLDADRLPLERDVVDLAEVAARVAARATALAAEKGVTTLVEGADAGPVLVIGDRLLLEQVALILVDNAIKYNRPHGQVALRAFRAGDAATLEVRDTGIGIAQEHLARLGERFYRVDKARSREAGGAGLGLSIARGVAGAHGGALTLSSTPGAGTVARLSLPAAVGSRQAIGDGRWAIGDRR